MNKLFLALAIGAPLYAACPAGYVQVTGALPTADGSGMTGYAIANFNGVTTLARTSLVRINVAGGAMTALSNGGLVCLAPGPYTVGNFPTNSQSFTTYWTVPSSGPVTVQSVEGSVVPTPGLTVALASLSQGGATSGQVLAWNGSVWGPATPSGGGTWGSITGTLSSQTDIAAALAGKQASLGFTPENAANKGAASGYAPLNSSSVVPLVNLPLIPLATGVSGNLATTNLNSGSSASNTTFWRGDGTWAIPSSSPYSGGTGINIVGPVISADTSVVTTKANLQSGAPLLVAISSTSGTTYVGSMSPTLTAYTAGQIALWNVGATLCTAGPVTLNIDTLGAKSIKEADGSTNPVSGDCTANRLVLLAYDGTVFRIIGGGH